MKIIKITLYAFIFICIGILFTAFIIDKKQTTNKPILSTFNDTLCEASVLYYLDLYNVPQKEIVLKQCLLETANLTSRLCIEDNNLFGLKRFSTGEYFKFNHFSESICMYKWTISYKYTGGCYYEFLVNLPYAEDSQYIDKLKEI